MPHRRRRLRAMMMQACVPALHRTAHPQWLTVVRVHRRCGTVKTLVLAAYNLYSRSLRCREAALPCASQPPASHSAPRRRPALFFREMRRIISRISLSLTRADKTRTSLQSASRAPA